MFNDILYRWFKSPALVRLAKGAIAAALSAGCAYVVQALGDTDPAVIPPVVVAVATPIFLALDKFVQAWGK